MGGKYFKRQENIVKLDIGKKKHIGEDTMTVLTATPDLKATFDKLIETMDVSVNWDGLFVVIDNCLILLGDVRSLFFHFDSQKVVTNIIDVEIKIEEAVMIEDNEHIKNVINMLLYAFGKWGNIKGLKVEKDYAQLNQLFKNILGEIDVEPEYTREHFWFYQKGIRIVYEDVVQCAIEYKEKEPEVVEVESQGLWHKLIWKQTYEGFGVEEISAKDRRQNRLGNNFYLTGYLCPECNTKMHSVVYPVGKEFVIDTNEGQVRLARAYTCNNCCSFYTPRPKRLLIDGDCYLMDFMGDRVAYEDYQELLGREGDKVSNFNYNEYVNEQKAADVVAPRKAQEPFELPELKLVLKELDVVSDKEFAELFAKMEENFYPDEILDEVEDAFWREYVSRETEKKAGKKRERKKHIWEIVGRSEVGEVDSKKQRDAAVKTDKAEVEQKSKEKLEVIDEKVVVEKVEKYQKRLELFPRLSARQRTELVKQITTDHAIPEHTRTELLSSAEKLKKQDNYVRLKEKVEISKNKNQMVMFRVYEEIQSAELEEPEREALLKMSGITSEIYEAYIEEKHADTGIASQKPKDGEKAEIENPKESITPNIQRVQKTIHYVESPREEKKAASSARVPQKQNRSEGNTSITEIGENTPVKDIRIINKRLSSVRASNREELQDILDSLFSGEFDKEEAAPYIEEVKEKIHKLDEAYLDSILGNMLQMSFEEGEEALEKLQKATLLPELKSDALKQLKRRLAKIKSDECELLVQKFKKELNEAGVKLSERQHFYPARRVLMEEATKEETEVVDYARASYGAGIGPFEYPIYLADTSRNQSGDKGMFITPENIYYSNLMTSYHISIFHIDYVEANTGLLNRGLYVYLRNGEKIKIPYTVENNELEKLADVLDGFIKYLQEKPFSRKEAYLAKESHEKICCFRCGHIYKGLAACPKCGYGANQ